MAFSDKLKQLRTKKGIKQSELAEILHLRQSSISDYENNRSTPNPETIKKIAEYFNVSANYLLDIPDKNDTKLDSTIKETIEELKNEDTLLFMGKNGDIDEETARLLKIAMKNAIKTVDDMTKKG
ncbi:TPA: helix-turn-helix domain-containing protein [Enterococcus faecalis]|uniref:helix-turn-helix domain-containing protein n=1 Tax=Enterococcus faecalis TaxID=1351 RepID=UPI00136A01EE|nr:helix-turn-helix domain-containing protein [Enterococcus faecalis]EGO2718648.1 helix-turn-helix domain-containing protein [Enterococcus faecalis]EGO6560752.1 helix-turn-helix domain-containing protein [Enterococcus faecalis]EGO7892798.1 helix-turn-helix domain-containing protein [Enterococcus faecalis]EGO9245652.1 helix-turn-helix domain-containing protein [Enterococcus faecalis]EIB3116140.1 helix-turn-helix domain-containing protein [Enterococcus faecalis]